MAQILKRLCFCDSRSKLQNTNVSGDVSSWKSMTAVDRLCAPARPLRAPLCPGPLEHTRYRNQAILTAHVFLRGAQFPDEHQGVGRRDGLVGASQRDSHVRRHAAMPLRRQIPVCARPEISPTAPGRATRSLASLLRGRPMRARDNRSRVFFVARSSLTQTGVSGDVWGWRHSNSLTWLCAQPPLASLPVAARDRLLVVSEHSGLGGAWQQSIPACAGGKAALLHVMYMLLACVCSYLPWDYMQGMCWTENAANATLGRTGTLVCEGASAYRHWRSPHQATRGIRPHAGTLPHVRTAPLLHAAATAATAPPLGSQRTCRAQAPPPARCAVRWRSSPAWARARLWTPRRRRRRRRRRSSSIWTMSWTRTNSEFVGV